MNKCMAADKPCTCQPTAGNVCAEVIALRKDAERYRWLRSNWARIVTDTVWAGVDEPRGVKAIELGAETLGSMGCDSLDRALDRCMAELLLHNVAVSGAKRPLDWLG